MVPDSVRSALPRVANAVHRRDASEAAPLVAHVVELSVRVRGPAVVIRQPCASASAECGFTAARTALQGCLHQVVHRSALVCGIGGPPRAVALDAFLAHGRAFLRWPRTAAAQCVSRRGGVVIANDTEIPTAPRHAPAVPVEETVCESPTGHAAPLPVPLTWVAVSLVQLEFAVRAPGPAESSSRPRIAPCTMPRAATAVLKSAEARA